MNQVLSSRRSLLGIAAAIGVLAGSYRPTDAIRIDVCLDRTSHDFGAVTPGAILTTAFVLSNRSDSPLQIADVVTTCGCITSGMSRGWLQGGQSEKLLVTLDTSGYTAPADLAKTIAVSLVQNGEQHIERLDISARLRIPFQQVPEHVVLSPTVDGQELVGSFVLQRDGLDVNSFRDLAIESSSKGVQVDAIEISDDFAHFEVRAVSAHLPMQTALTYASSTGRHTFVVPLKTPLQNQVRAVPSCLVLTDRRAENLLDASSDDVARLRLVAQDESECAVTSARFDDVASGVPLIARVDAENPRQVNVSIGFDKKIPSPRDALLRVSFTFGGDKAGEIVVPVYVVPETAGGDSQVQR